MISVFTLLMALFVGMASCQLAGDPRGATSEVISGRNPNASVSGTITYRERIALSDAAIVIVELRDVSLADAPAPLIAKQTISDPGQVPIEFRVPYSREDIDPRNTYGISARIVESDERLAFINDTAHDVITRGNPSRVDMVLVVVQPPQEMLDDRDSQEDWRTWVEAPANVLSANLMHGEPEHLLRVVYRQSTIEGCARQGNRGLRVDGNDIYVTLTLMQPPDTPWAIPCDEETVELDEVFHLEPPLQSRKTYRVAVNGRTLSTFTLPNPGLGHTLTARSAIRSVEAIDAGGGANPAAVSIVSGRPSGICTQYNGYELQVSGTNIININIFHHQVADPLARCTKDYPVDETLVPLDLDLEPGSEYTVVVNGEASVSFVAR